MSDDRAAEARRLREQADKADEIGKRHPHFAQEAERLRERADRMEAGEARTAEDFVEDYNDAEMRLHTSEHVEALVEHARKWEAEVRADKRAQAGAVMTPERLDLIRERLDVTGYAKWKTACHELLAEVDRLTEVLTDRDAEVRADERARVLAYLGLDNGRSSDAP